MTDGQDLVIVGQSRQDAPRPGLLTTESRLHPGGAVSSSELVDALLPEQQVKLNPDSRYFYCTF
jgi:hypothetical protein